MANLRSGRLELLNSERRFQLLVDAVKDYAIYLLDRDGYISSWNTGAQRFKGYTADEILGQHFSRFYTEEDRAVGLPQRALRIASEEGRFEAEGWRVRKDGTRFWTSVVIDPVHDEDGTLIGFAKITRDITERRRAQQEIEAARVALMQAQKMEAVGRLTGGVAHDFNNLLTVIRASVGMLKRPGLSEEKRRHFIEAIAETAERATALTSQLLAFARKQPLRREHFDVAARLEAMRHIITTTLGATIAVRYDLEAGVGEIESDPSQFETAVLNIVINARDAMPDGGELRMTLRRVDAPPRVLGLPAGAYAAIGITDTGTGIDEETLQHIFEPFFTTKEVNKGTGLGLSQVHGFIKASGGDITVDSRVGEGTVFTLYLPLASGSAPHPSDDEEPVATAPRAGRVLLVEDNAAVGDFANALLAELGQDVTWVRDAAQALELLARRAEDFDLVLTDVVMPGMTGLELGKLIQARWPQVPVVLMSGYSHVLLEDKEHGFDLLQKPYTVEDLEAVLRKHVRGTPSAPAAAKS
ncbi:MAG TPA: PAS domain S-box protein [Lysobacter sp.]|nr:PAS domain S-box protein [Lysobacter sp.]